MKATLAHDDIQFKFFQRRIKRLLHRPAETVNFIDKENIPFI